MGMRRFVTYLYECANGNKLKNVGFIRVNVKDEKVRMEVFIRNLLRGKDIGKLYVLAYKKKLLGNRTTLVSTKVFTNKVEAMTYQNNNTGDGYVATIEKWDPTKNR